MGFSFWVVAVGATRQGVEQLSCQAKEHGKLA
jgi:hypothetical protein